MVEPVDAKPTDRGFFIEKNLHIYIYILKPVSFTAQLWCHLCALSPSQAPLSVSEVSVLLSFGFIVAVLNDGEEEMPSCD